MKIERVAEVVEQALARREREEGEAGEAGWSLLLTLRAGKDELADLRTIGRALPWLSGLGLPGVGLCEELLRRGLGILTCASEEEARRLAGQVRGSRVEVRLVGRGGEEERPPRRRADAASEEAAARWSFPDHLAEPEQLEILIDRCGEDPGTGPPAAGPVPSRLRRERGVYFTPPPLVRYLVRSVDLLLRTRLGYAAGLADPRVRLLDPAAGPANFLLEVWAQAAERHRRQGGKPGELLRTHLLPHVHGFELLPALHAAGLSALGGYLTRLGETTGAAPSAALIAADALAPPAVLLSEPFNVVLGNPPWRGRSQNRGAWSAALLEGYERPDGSRDEGCFRLDGRPLGERNPKWVRDDWVKFLRLAQWRIDQTGEGVVAFVLNHNGLDAPTFRGLRRSLLGSFEEVYAFDLHGNRRRREAAPGGGADENVFPGIAQGVALLFLVKRPGLPRRVLRADLYGSRQRKLKVLGGGDLGSTFWTEIQPGPPSYLFVRGDRALEREYRQGLSLPEIFPVHGTGLITGRDRWATALDRKALERRLAELRRRPLPEVRVGLTDHEAAALRRDRAWRSRITGLLARPFDVRQVFAADYFLARPRRAVLGHLGTPSSVGLAAARQSREGPGVLVTRWLTGHKAVSRHDVSSVFPLYLDPEGERVANFSPGFRRELRERCGGELPDPGRVLAFLYAVLYSPAYRQRYRELLARDFPRIPLPRDREHFEALAGPGGALVEAHLLGGPGRQGRPIRLGRDARQPLGRFPSTVGRLGPEGRLPLAESLYLEGLAPEVWEYRIGGYRVLPQWLKARAGQALGPRGLAELRAIARALRRTLRIETTLAELPFA